MSDKNSYPTTNNTSKLLKVWQFEDRMYSKDTYPQAVYSALIGSSTQYACGATAPGVATRLSIVRVRAGVRPSRRHPPSAAPPRRW